MEKGFHLALHNSNPSALLALSCSHQLSLRDFSAEHADCSMIVSVYHHEMVPSRHKGKTLHHGRRWDVSHKFFGVLHRVVFVVAMPSATARIWLKIFAFGELLTCFYQATCYTAHSRQPANNCWIVIIHSPCWSSAGSLSIRHWVTGGLAFSHWSDTIRRAHPYNWLQDQVRD